MYTPTNPERYISGALKVLGKDLLDEKSFDSGLDLGAPLFSADCDLTSSSHLSDDFGVKFRSMLQALQVAIENELTKKDF